MIPPERTVMSNDRLMDLERTVALLNHRLRTIQWGLQQDHTGSLKKRLWSFMRSKPEGELMSAVCNQRVRPNMKVATHESARA